MDSITGKKAAFLASNGFCEREYIQSYKALNGLGVDCRLISVDENLIQAWNEIENKHSSHWGHGYAPDKKLSDAIASEYDVLVIPGGVRSIQKLKLSPSFKPFAGSLIKSGKPVIVYNKAIGLMRSSNLVNGYDVVSDGEYEDNIMVSRNLITLSGYVSNADQDVREFVRSILQVNIQDDDVTSHKAA